MSFMNKVTFELCNNVFEDDNKDDFIEIDEHISLAIQILNKKGYKTEFCCSGHLSKHEFYTDVQNMRTNEISRGAKITNLNDFAYIQFVESYNFNSTPKRFVLEKAYDGDLRKLTYHFKSGVDTLSRLVEIMETMKELTIWAYELPNLNNCEV